MSFFGSYCLVRLRWYLRASVQATLRRWQWLLLVALLVPGVPVVPLLSALASGLLTIVSPGLAAPIRLIGIAAVVAFAGLWVLPQRQTILGGKFASYAATLPVSSLVRFAVDLTVLCAADALPLLLLAIALTRADVMSTLLLLGLVAAALAAQVLVLRPCILPAISWPTAMWPSLEAALPSALSIQLRIIGEQKGETLLRVAAVVAIALADDRLIIAFGLDGRSLPTSIVAVAVICLLVSGLYRPLHDAHRGAHRLLATLPLSSAYWPIRDVGFVVLLGAPALGIVLVWLGLQSILSAEGLVILGLACVALLSLLRLPVIFGGRLATFFAALIAVAWAGAGFAAVLR